MTTLKLHNTLSGKKEEFVPLDPAHIRMYACGPTVYDYAHLGNGRMAVVFDLLATVLRGLYPKVTYVSNITDVEDKIMDAAVLAGEPIAAITRRYESIYNGDMEALGCTPPDIQPRATEHIQEMIAQIEQLIARGHAYTGNGHVLFNVPSYPAYGRLSNRNRDDQIAGARVEVAPYKKDPADFVLWKPSTPDQPGWESPWGFGRPGWHIECSAMAEKHLGLPFDIHGGGADLKFPHHENEIAQSCCAHGHENDPYAFAKLWVHNGFLTVEGEKMSKSLGNFLLVHNLVKEYPGEVLRLALLSAHYRQPLDWTNALLVQSKSILDSFYRTLYAMRDIQPEQSAVAEKFMTPLLDDLNTAGALTVLQAMEKELSSAAEDDRARLKGDILAAGNLLGLLKTDPAVWLGYGQANDVETVKIDRLVAERQAAKKDKNFKRADEIRDILAAQGIAIEDTPAGPLWRQI